MEVESWLKSLNLARGTRYKIRNVMSVLFNHGRRQDLCDRNPIEWVRQSAKRRSAPDILTSNEVPGLLANLRFRKDVGATCSNHRPPQERAVRVEMERRGSRYGAASTTARLSARTDEKGFGVNCALTAKHGIRHSLRLAFERRFWLMLIPLGRWNVGVWRAIGKALECVSNT